MALRSTLKGPLFPAGILVMTGGTLIQELTLSTEHGGVTTDLVPSGLLAALAAGLAIGFLARDREKGPILGFVSGYVGVIIGSGVFAAIHWGLRPEAGPYGWVAFLAGGVLVGVAIGWVAAIAAAGSTYVGSMLGERFRNRGKVVGLT